MSSAPLEASKEIAAAISEPLHARCRRISQTTNLAILGESDLALTRGHLLEKAMAPHSSTLAWKIPWTEEPGGLQSMGSLRVRHD